MFGDVLEVLLWFFGRLSEGNNKGKTENNNILIIWYNIIVFVLCLISRCGYTFCFIIITSC